MSHIIAMLKTHPNDTGGVDVQKLVDCIAACFECAQTCTASADACLAEDMVDNLRNCIRHNSDCADVCAATGVILSRRTGQNPRTVRAMLEVCRSCEQACADLLAAMD